MLFSSFQYLTARERFNNPGPELGTDRISNYLSNENNLDITTPFFALAPGRALAQNWLQIGYRNVRLLKIRFKNVTIFL